MVRAPDRCARCGGRFYLDADVNLRVATCLQCGEHWYPPAPTIDPWVRAAVQAPARRGRPRKERQPA